MMGLRRDLQIGECHNPGEYGRLRDHWMCCTPNGLAGNLRAHDVTEHEDGTISVSPSILATPVGTNERWHGYLKRGIWKEC